MKKTMMKKRFIAGAVCPKCGAKDSVRVYLPEANEPDEQTRDCVDCGYKESLAKPMVARNELTTRVNKSAVKTISLNDIDEQTLTLQ